MGYVTVERDLEHPNVGLESHLCDLARLIETVDTIVGELLEIGGDVMSTKAGAKVTQDHIGRLAVMMGIIGEFAGAAKDEFYAIGVPRRAVD